MEVSFENLLAFNSLFNQKASCCGWWLQMFCSDQVRNILIAFPISTQWVLLNLPTIHKTDWRITLLTANGLVKNPRNSLVSQLFTLMTSFEIILSHSSLKTKVLICFPAKLYSVIFSRNLIFWNFTNQPVFKLSQEHWFYTWKLRIWFCFWMSTALIYAAEFEQDCCWSCALMKI